MNKIVGVFFGSRSPEHDISIITGQLIISTLKKLGITAVPVYLGKEGEWYIGPELGALKTFTNGALPILSDKLQEYYLDLKRSHGMMVFRRKGLLTKEVIVEVAFPALHGSYGEDGTIQGLFEMIDVPYVGCGVTASAVAMDKVLTKQMCTANNIPTIDYVYYMRHDWQKRKNEILKEIQKKLSWPMITKPAHLGSSIGIVKVKNAKELEEALEVGFHYDEKVLVEKCVENLADITCVLMGNKEPVASVLQESTFDKDIFSYEDKYLNDGGAQLGNGTKNLHIPARLDKKTTETIRKTAIDTYKALELSGISRVDFIYDTKKKKYYVSEINPLPGTLYHHLWKASGVEIEEVVKKLLEYAMERHDEKKQTTLTFQNDLLKYAGSIKLSMKGT